MCGKVGAMCHSLSEQPPSPLSDGKNLLPNFQKGGRLDRTLIVREGLVGKRGGDLFEGGEVQFLQKSKRFFLS